MTFQEVGPHRLKKKKKSQDTQMNKTLQKSSKNRSTKLLEQSEVEYKISILLMFTEIKGSEKRSKNQVIIKMSKSCSKMTI